MSECIKVTPESTEQPDKMLLRTNLALLDDKEEAETYLSSLEMEEGSVLAQMLAPIDGISRLDIQDRYLVIWKEEDVSWHSILSDVTDALKEFFL